ncbi:T9SS type A sorting domain-containing protein [Rubrivirga marina]|uniref:T9SS type A sorting domain-containing protein n=1 Tax=Rubrivirga marina TaxID=1196024 RepID=UPI000BA9235E|nr:T9SS type A sorting domain-containing protein [Rubrivirga marina]
MQRTATLLVLGLLMAGPALAQPDRVGQDVVWARDIGSASITLDGMLNEPEWASAETLQFRWNDPLGFPGSGQFFETNPFGLTDPADPTDATMYFLRKGNDLYIGMMAQDESVGGATSLWNFDGIIMAMTNKANRPDDFSELDDYSGFGAVRAEFFYAWFHPADTTDTGMVVPGIDPRGFSNFFGVGFGDPMDAERNEEAWDYATTVDGVANDDFNGGSEFTPDNGYTMEMRIALDSLGWSLSEPMARVPISLAVEDADYGWPQDPEQYVATRTWWQSRWGNNYNEGVAYVAGDPSVTVSSGPAPAYTEPEFTVPSGLNLPEVTVDGMLDEPAWDAIDPQFRLQYQADADFLDANLPGPVAQTNTFYFHPDENPVLDPTIGNISMFYKGSRLYIGLDTDDQAINGSESENTRDGFRLIIRSRDSTIAGLQYAAEHLRLDFSIDSTGAVRFTNAPDELLVDGVVETGVSFKGASTVADPSDIDTGYQMEVSIDLSAIGYDGDLESDGAQIYIALNYFDGDSLEDDAQSYGTRTWIVGERGNGAAIYGYLDPATLVNTAAEGAPGADVLQIGATYPNPSTGLTTLRYELSRAAEVTVEVFDVLGRRVQRTDGVARAAGVHEATVDGRALSAGAYVVRVSLADGTTATGRMLIAR